MSIEMRITIDPDKCQGHARCWLAAPDVFTLDEMNFGHVIGDGGVQDDRYEDVLMAIANCPERAIREEKPDSASGSVDPVG